MEEGRAVTDIVYGISCGELQLQNNPRILVDAVEVDARRGDPDYLIIDARSRRYYEGYYDTVQQEFVGGHIEGAVTLPYADLLSDSVPCMFTGDEEMGHVFSDAGMEDEKILIHTCGSGIAACVTYVVAKHLGYSSLFYDGSFQDWTNRDMSIATSY